MENFLRFFKKIIPPPIFAALQPLYHWVLAWAAAAFYWFPSRKLKVIGVTGTNGKSTIVHLITAILEEAGERAASVSSIRFRIGAEERRNDLKMTMPGRFKLQRFLRRAVNAGCKYAVIEVTSEGIQQYRHLGINFFMAVLTNVTPEHIESHGSFEKYRAAKAELFRKATVHILNGEDPSVEYFLKIPAPSGRGSPKGAGRRIVFTKKKLPPDIHLRLLGEFNLENAVAAYHAAKILGIEREAIKRALEKVECVPGRLEFIQRELFSVVVDYAHTPDALRKVYETLRPPSSKSPAGKKSDFFGDLKSDFKEAGDFFPGGRLVCVLGAAGGGRDEWKRPEMGKIASRFCDEIILTNEDPYDENPAAILNDIEAGFSKITNYKSQIPNSKQILDRREAIRSALKSAQSGDIVIITGKGSEPWIMGPNGTQIPWDDREVVREELKKIDH